MAKLTNWRSNFILRRSPRSDLKKTEVSIKAISQGFEISDNDINKTFTIEMTKQEIIELSLCLNKNIIPIYTDRNKSKIFQYDHLPEFKIEFMIKHKNGEIDFVFYDENGKYCALLLDGKIIENII